MQLNYSYGGRTAASSHFTSSVYPVDRRSSLSSFYVFSSSRHCCRVAEMQTSAPSVYAPASYQQPLRPPQPFFAEQGDDEVSSSALMQSEEDAASGFVRQRPATYSNPSIGDLETLRPRPEWYPAWMQYRRRESNYVFWCVVPTACDNNLLSFLRMKNG